MAHGKGVRRDPQSSSIPTRRLNQVLDPSTPCVTLEELISQWCDGLPEISNLGNASWKIPGLIGISKLESQLQN